MNVCFDEAPSAGVKPTEGATRTVNRPGKEVNARANLYCGGALIGAARAA